MGKKRRKPRNKTIRQITPPVKPKPVIEPVSTSHVTREVLAMRIKIDEMEQAAAEAKRREENYLRQIGSPDAPKSEPVKGALRATMDGYTSPSGKMVMPHPDTNELNDKHIKMSGINVDYLLKEALIVE